MDSMGSLTISFLPALLSREDHIPAGFCRRAISDCLLDLSLEMLVLIRTRLVVKTDDTTIVSTLVCLFPGPLLIIIDDLKFR